MHPSPLPTLDCLLCILNDDLNVEVPDTKMKESRSIPFPPPLPSSIENCISSINLKIPGDSSGLASFAAEIIL